MRILFSLLLLLTVSSCASTQPPPPPTHGFLRQDNSMNGQFHAFGQRFKNLFVGDGFFDSDSDVDRTDYGATPSE